MSNPTAATSAAATLSPEQARTLFDHLLPAIVSSRALTREMIRNVSDSKLGFQPVAGGESLSDLMWYLASAYDVFLNALCDAKFPDLPAKPQPASVEAFLAWDDTRFEQTVQRAKSLSDADLLRPLSFGPFTQPAVEFMAMFVGNVAQHTGQLMMGLALAAQANGEQPAANAPVADGELSDAELAGVAGGVTIIHNYNANEAIHGKPPEQQHNVGLGALFGSSGPATQGSMGLSLLPGLVINGGMMAMRIAQGFAIAAFLLRF